MNENKEVITQPREFKLKLPGRIVISLEQVRNGTWVPNKEKPGRGSYVITTESSYVGFAQTFYNFIGSEKLGIGLLFKQESYTPLKLDGTVDSEIYPEIELERLLEESLEKNRKISLGVLKKKEVMLWV